MSDYRRWFVAGGTYFFTLVTLHRYPFFRDSIELDPAKETVMALREQLSAAVETDEKGQKSLKINLPSEEALSQFAEALAKLMALRQ
jgi:hypothetical protein